MLTALLLSSTVFATEIGTSKKFGIGIASGAHYFSITGKYYLDEKSGISCYIGNSWLYQGLRANYEREFYPVGNWGWANLDLYWAAGLDLGLWTYYGNYPAVFGVGGGIGADLQFEDIPLSIFGDVGVGLYPVNAYDSIGKFAGFGLFAPRTALGARFYF